MTPVQALIKQAATKYAASPPTVKAPAPTGGAVGATPKLSTGGAPSLNASPAKLSTPASGGGFLPGPIGKKLNPYMLSTPAQNRAGLQPTVVKATTPASMAPPAAGSGNKAKDHYFLPPDNHGLAFGPRGGAAPYEPSWERFTALGSPHRQYIDKVEAQYDNTDINGLIGTWRRQPMRDKDTGKVLQTEQFENRRYAPADMEKEWQGFVDAHPVADEFTPPKPTWFGDDSAALNNAREETIEKEEAHRLAPSSLSPSRGQFLNTAQQAPAQPTAPTPAPVQPAAPNPAAHHRPFDDNFSTSLQSAPKEQQPQIAQQAVQQHMQEQPAAIQKGLQDAHAGHDTPEAQQFSQQVDAKGQEVMKANVDAQLAADPTRGSTAQGFGQMWNQASEAWNGMPQEAKWMVGLGVPMAAVGLMSSLFGGGGGGIGLLGLLGLGAAGLGGAAGGLFGEGAANMSADAMYNIGTFTGMMPEKADLSRLKGENPVAAMGNEPIGTREETAKQIAEGKAQMGQLRQLMSLPVGEDAKMRLMQRLDPSLDTPEAVQQAYQNAGTMIQQYDDPESELNKKMQEGQNYADSTGLYGWGAENLYAPVSNWWNGKQSSAATPVLNLIEKWAFNDMDAKELLDLEKAQSQKYDLKNARRLEELKKRKLADAPVDVVGTCMKAARCWAGYEPVPGKKPYSNDSCRPAGSKKKKKTIEKK